MTTNKNLNKALLDVHFKEMNPACICEENPKLTFVLATVYSLNYVFFLIPNSGNNNYYHL